MSVKIAMLQAISNDDRITITNIMYRSNVSYNVVRKYVGELVAQGLVSEINAEGKRTYYSLTTKGYEVLAGANQMYKDFRN